MGAGPFSGRKSCSTFDTSQPIKDINPKADNYKILHSVCVNGNLVLELEYPDCTNFEGRKILVYKKTTFLELMQTNKGLLDPHFHNEHKTKAKSPFARFVPTAEGWQLALAFAKLL